MRGATRFVAAVAFLLVVVACGGRALVVPQQRSVGETPNNNAAARLREFDSNAEEPANSWDAPQNAEVRQKLESEHGIRSNCTLSLFEVPLDHFSFVKTSPASFKMRVYTCMDETWQAGDPIFYYTGNEAPIEFFMRWSGLLWQHAKQAGAKLVWAEHRYFGESRPWANESMPPADKLKWLTPDQALADYNLHISHLRYSADVQKKNQSARDSAIVGFGGSYGGLLCAWMRAKYPYALDGCVASSAPVALFDGMHPPLDKDHLAMIVTKDATSSRGASPGCSGNVRTAFKAIEQMGQTAAGLAELSKVFSTCEPLSAATGGSAAVMGWAQSALIAMAQNSFPFPSDLMLLGSPGKLPAYPLRAACAFIGSNQSFPTNRSLLEAFAKGLSVYFNASGSASCFDMAFSFPPSKTASKIVYLWQYIACSSVMLATSSNGVTDMFFPNPYNRAAQVAACQQQYSGGHLTPDVDYVAQRFGGRAVGTYGTNIVFSNGEYDPIRAGSIVNASDCPGENNTPLVFPALGHTGDLAFSHPQDSAGVIANRMREVAAIDGFIAMRRKKRQMQQQRR